MNLFEFKAWFEGFTEGIDGPPSERQWKRIQEKIGKIADAPPTTPQHFYHHYYHPWQRWFPYTSSVYWGVAEISTPVSAVSSNVAGPTGPLLDATHFDSGTAFRALGQAEAASIR